MNWLVNQSLSMRGLVTRLLPLSQVKSAKAKGADSVCGTLTGSAAAGAGAAPSFFSSWLKRALSSCTCWRRGSADASVWARAETAYARTADDSTTGRTQDMTVPLSCDVGT